MKINKGFASAIALSAVMWASVGITAAHAADFDCNGIKVTYQPMQIPVEGQQYQETMLLVGGVPVANLTLSGDFGLNDTDSLQLLGDLNSGRVNFRSMPAKKIFEIDIISQGSRSVTYKCNRTN